VLQLGLVSTPGSLCYDVEPRARLQRLRVQLDAQAAVRSIGSDQRAALVADTDALVAETGALLGAA